MKRANSLLFRAIAVAPLLVMAVASRAADSSVEDSPTPLLQAPPQCIIFISGIEVDLGAASFRQCVSYARSSLIGKADTPNRNIKSDGVLYRVTARNIDTTPDNGKTWVEALGSEQIAPRLNSVAAAPPVEKAPVNQVPVMVAPSAQISSSVPILAAAVRPAKVVEKSSTTETESIPAPSLQLPTPAPTVPKPVARNSGATSPAVNEIDLTPLPGKPLIPASPEPSPRPAPKIDAKPDVQFYRCDYSANGVWDKLIASSIKQCIAKIRDRTQNLSSKGPISAYWNDTFITLTGEVSYTSDDGKSWTVVR